MVSQEELNNASWRKSSRSDSGSGGCVSIALLGVYCAVRDSKDVDGPVLIFSTATLCTLFTETKRGKFDLPTCGTNGGAAG
ncbi:DUF397 domain-containing protein [Actinomadura sp. HBU206391]|uniref:DUF397 domain-containing protein n=1 Tax=Actinomadura sp. HBU206391 TaxID=2731692 RepID=UPI0016502329|nr:DUF397 domain-containing protein [Actinomadura sp. HBU206391]MBC6459873.1 DUF397 domain-containing protein [Actinomadura sp. HBU206391]